jgi:hypothetical protein
MIYPHSLSRETKIIFISQQICFSISLFCSKHCLYIDHFISRLRNWHTVKENIQGVLLFHVRILHVLLFFNVKTVWKKKTCKILTWKRRIPWIFSLTVCQFLNLEMKWSMYKQCFEQNRLMEKQICWDMKIIFVSLEREWG